MSQRAALRGLVLIASFLTAASPATATILITVPGGQSIPVYEIDVLPGTSSPMLEARILFDIGSPPAGTETLTFTGLPPGATTVPSVVSYVVSPAQTLAAVTFQIAVAAGTLPGSYPIMVENAPTAAGSAELLLVVPGISISPGTVNVVVGTTSSPLSAWISPYDPQTFTGTQTLLFSGLPAGVTTVPSPVIYQVFVTRGDGPAGPERALQSQTVAFQIAVGPSTLPGSYPISVQNSPAAAGTSTFTLNVVPPPSFSVAPGAGAISVCSGGPAASNTVTVTPLSGYQGSPTVTFPNLPSGLTITPSSIPVPLLPPVQTVSFDVSAAAGMTAGPRVVNVLVQDQAGVSAQTTFTVNVGAAGFAPSVAPASVSLRPNGPAATVLASVALSSCPPQSTIQVTPTSIPHGISVSPSSVFLPAPSFQPASFSISASGSAAPGRSTVTFTFSLSGGATRTATVEVVVRSVGSLSVAVENSTLTVCPGGAAVPNSVTVTPLGGYTGSPTLTFPALPAELEVSPVTIPIGALPPARTASFVVSAIAGALPGQKVVNVRVGDASGPSAVTSFVVNVRAADFTPVVSPATVELNSGGEAVTVTASIAPDACSPPPTITVTPSGLPAGVTVTPASAVLVAPSFTPVVFTLSASGSVPTGSVGVTFVFQPSTGAPKSTTTPVSIIRNGRMGIEVERASMEVCPGGAVGPNSLTISPLEGYSGTPTVSFPNLPAGLTVTPATIPVLAIPPARTVLFTVTAAPGTPPGPATLTALVSDPRGISSTVTFVANVLPPAFTPAAGPSAVTLNAGGAAATLTASLEVGGCAPTSDVTVTPSGLPPGMTVTPTFAALAPPAFAPAAFSFQASSSVAPGPWTITFTFATSGATPKNATTVITVCGPPAAPVSPVVTPRGNPQGPVTATDFLTLGWDAPASGFAPTRYEWRINGGPFSSVAGTSASAPPRGAIDPVQLFVRAYSCNPERGPGTEASSPVYSLAAPVASFSVPASIVAGRAVTFTDTSSPQATSWLWFPGDGIPATTVQSPTVTFPAAGTRTIVLIASNGSGTSSKTTTINVLPASSARTETGYAVRSLDRATDGRLALGRVEVEAGTTLILRRLEGDGEAVAFLRLLDADGRAVIERRLVLAAGEEARHDLSAWGARGIFRVELVGPEGLEAAVEEMAIPFGEPDLPVTPRRPRSAGIH